MAKGWSLGGLIAALKLPAFSEFGTTAGTVAQGNDARFIGRSLGPPQSFRSSTGSGVFVPDPIARFLLVRMVGGGGPGGFADACNPRDYSVGAGGGAGGFIEMWIDLSLYTGSLAMVVGSAGTWTSSQTTTNATKTTFAGQTCNPGGAGAMSKPSAPANVIVGGGFGGGVILVTTTGVSIIRTSSGSDGYPGMRSIIGNSIAGQGGQSEFGAGGHATNGGTGAGEGPGAHGAGGGGAITANTNPLGGAAIAGQRGGTGGNGRIDIYQYSNGQ